MEQIKAENPPPNPAKITDTRCKKYISQFGQMSWELDALNPDYLARLITSEVLKLRDETLYRNICMREKADRSELFRICTNYDRVVDFLK